MTDRNPFVFELPGRRALHGLVDLSERPGARPTVVVCHGFKGFQEWGFFPAIAELLAERGFTVVRFNFASSGMEPGDELVTDLEAFRTTPISRDLEDLQLVVAALGHRIAAGRVDTRRIGLLGHSRGGGVALLAAAHSELRDEIGALVTWAAIGSTDRLSAEEKARWRADGALPIENARTGQQLELGTEVLDDLDRNAAELDLAAAAARRTAPWLLIHGEADATVPVAEAEALATAAADPSRLLRIEAGEHTFGAKHPFAGPTPHLIAALNATQAWFREYLC